MKVEVVEASHPDFAGALVAAVEGWRFSPKAASASPEKEYFHEFHPGALPAVVIHLVARRRDDPTGASKAGPLDARPELPFRPKLVHPLVAKADPIEGNARVEVLIDRTGLAQLPRVLECDRPEFGWAAAAWAGRMRFKPPTRGGRPAEARVVLPVAFLLPPDPKAPAPR